jgi:hypothetical protein
MIGAVPSGGREVFTPSTLNYQLSTILPNFTTADAFS